MTDAKADKITIERETLQWALDALCELSGPGDLDVCDDLRAALAAQPATVQPVEPVARRPAWAVVALAALNNGQSIKPGGAIHEAMLAAPPAPAAVPLTEEVLNIHKPYYSNIEWPCFKAGVRFAEMVHAIAAAGDKP